MNADAVFERGGPIILRDDCGNEAHVIPPIHLGNDMDGEELLGRLVAAMETKFGKPIDTSVDESEIQIFGWPVYLLEKTVNAERYSIELRSRAIDVGASGVIEQIILGIVGALSYDALKGLAVYIAKQVYDEIASHNMAGEVETSELLEERLRLIVAECRPDFELKEMLSIPGSGRRYAWRLVGSNGKRAHAILEGESIVLTFRKPQGKREINRDGGNEA